MRRPRGGIQSDTYPFETLNRPRQQLANDPMELTLGRMGELSTSTKDLEIGRFREYVAFSMRGFGNFKATIGTWRYGSDLEAPLKRQSLTHREILSRQGVRAPITNRISRECPTLGWGLDYGSTPGAGALILNDFIPRHAGKLDDFRIFGDKLETRDKPPGSI